MIEAKSRYESNLVTNFALSNNSKIYSYIKSFSKHSDLPPTISFDSVQATNSADKAAVFNRFFHSIFNNKSPAPSTKDLYVPEEQLCTITFSEMETYEALSSVNPSKASGVDGIPSKVWWFTALALYQPVHHLFSSKSYILLEWRIHQIIPIPKTNNNNTSLTNYRPISLLCCISKVLEKIIFDKSIDFLTINVISSSQFGFVKKRSTVQQLLTFFSFVFQSLDHKTQVDTIYLDIRKAFDTVPHSELLSDRQQFVSIDGCSSGLLPVTSGVPQGSILGPMLFVVYINSLPDVIRFVTCLLFADDTKCCHSISSFSDTILLQNDITSLLTWSDKSKLSFNLSKNLMLRFTNRSTNIIDATYSLDGSPIQSVTSCKDLGVTVSSDLSWL